MNIDSAQEFDFQGILQCDAGMKMAMELCRLLYADCCLGVLPRVALVVSIPTSSDLPSVERSLVAATEGTSPTAHTSGASTFDNHKWWKHHRHHRHHYHHHHHDGKHYSELSDEVSKNAEDQTGEKVVADNQGSSTFHDEEYKKYHHHHHHHDRGMRYSETGGDDTPETDDEPSTFDDEEYKNPHHHHHDHHGKHHSELSDEEAKSVDDKPETDDDDYCKCRWIQFDF